MDSFTRIVYNYLPYIEVQQRKFMIIKIEVQSGMEWNVNEVIMLSHVLSI